MGIQERDYMLRMIAAAAAIARRLRERLAGGASGVDVVREAREAQGDLLGKDATLLRQLDAASAVALLADRGRAEQWAELMTVEAEALGAAGDVRAALVLDRSKAIALAAQQLAARS